MLFWGVYFVVFLVSLCLMGCFVRLFSVYFLCHSLWGFCVCFADDFDGFSCICSDSV